MKSMITKCMIASAALLLGNIAIADEDAPKPVREPAVPAKLAEKGVVYHTIADRHAQVTFTSAAPLQNIVGKSNAIVGYAVSGSEESPAALAGAQWLLPIDSLATGIPLRDEHMAGDHWLDAKSFPIISFTLTSTEDAKLIKSGEGFSTWSVTLVGDLKMHGKTRSMRVENAKLSFLKASPKTERIAKGDLLFLKCAYEIKISDYGIKNSDVPGKVSDVIKMGQMLRLSTIRQDPKRSTTQDQEANDGGAESGRDGNAGGK